MTRIVPREEPYLDIRSMNRHHKAKQAITLKALSKASFINGSSFLVAWVSPQGTFSLFASEFLQAGVDRMFTPELRQECVEMAKKGREIREKDLTGSGGKGGGGSASMDGMGDEQEGEDEEEGIGSDEDEQEPVLSALGAAVAAVGNVGASKGRVNTRAQLASSNASSSSLPTPAATASSSTSSPAVYTPTPINSHRNIDPAVTEFLLDRLNTLGRPTSKTVSKSWSAATKHSYRDGSDPPSFWPIGVTYKDPKDLSDDDRSLFLLSLLREPSLSIQRLELATASVGALISANKAPLLRQIYKIARMEESGLPIDLSRIVESPAAVGPVEIASVLGPPVDNSNLERKTSSGFGEGNLAWLFEGDGNGVGLEDRRGKMAEKKPSMKKKIGLQPVESEDGSVASSSSRKRTASAMTLEGSQQEKKTKAQMKTQKSMVVDQENMPRRNSTSSTSSSSSRPQPDRQPFGQSNHPHQVYDYQQPQASVTPYLQPPHQFQPSPYYSNNSQLHPSSCQVDASPSHYSSSSSSADSPYPSQYGAPPPPPHHQYPQQFSPYSQSPYSPALDPYAPPPNQSLRQAEFYHDAPPPPPPNDQLSSLPIQRTHSAPPISTSTSGSTQYLPQPQPPRIARRPPSRVQQLASPLYNGAAPSLLRTHSFDGAVVSHSTTSINTNQYYHPPAQLLPPPTPVMDQNAFAWQEEYSGFSMPGGGFGLGIRMGGDGAMEGVQSPMEGEMRFGDEFVHGRG